MKTFFYYFFRLRWIKAVWSLFVADDVIELDTFFEDPPQMILCHIIGGIDRKKLIKCMKRITKGVKLTPANINTLSGMIKSPDEILDELLETTQFCYIVVSGKAYKDIESLIADGGERTAEYENFRFHLRHNWDNSLDEKIEDDIGTAWYQSLCRQGMVDKECPNCETENFLNLDSIVCKYCDTDYDMDHKVPDSPVKMYKEITAYEGSSGKIVLQKVA